MTERLGIAHPILSAPMALAGGRALAAAVTRAGEIAERMVAEATALLGGAGRFVA
ncbi:hypothetical protein [Bosea sp. ASV33]|uniref:hypothetical protein n=1 Tax=Bosea sp. ASV33 TaxID=2795106 RepID=UPI0018ED67D6|nr:hypothetical protein [Bosea sp. ASV33]